ncbi:MAG: tRNA (adenosine(37)-N6)-dimethylallyltransferase MiaA [bacterium]|nr:tRNA (adenosine(37)-N6)-dimethylallyltransferase MiaA [bacterium]
MPNQKIIVMLGPTATGKSDLAVFLAKKFSGEVVSADSRQVYKGLDIGTGKVPRDPTNYKLQTTNYLYKGVPHHLIDVANPKRVFTVSQYKKFGEKALQDIWQREKLPIICGGTGFYIQALIDGIILPEVPPNKKLRTQLEKKSVAELFTMLKKLDPRRSKEIDRKNPRRLIRAIEIAKYLGKVPYLEARLPSNTDILQIGIDMPDEMLKERIGKRLKTRIKKGMIREAIRLNRQGLSWKRMEGLGLEYRYMARYLQGKISKEEMVIQLAHEIWQYAKRQRTWFKRDKRIKWVLPKQKKIVEKLVSGFLWRMR